PFNTFPDTAWRSSRSIMRFPPGGPAFGRRSQTVLEYWAFPAFLLLCRVPSKLLCFANAKILTLAGGSTAEHEWIIDEDSRVPSQSHPRALWRHHSPGRSRFHERGGPRRSASA